VTSLLRRLRSHLFDPVVPASFGRPGFLRHAELFDPTDLDVDLRGQRIVITGGTSGIGLAAARALKGLGADVVVLGRDASKGQLAVEQLSAHKAGSAAFVRCDIGDFTSVDAAVREIGARSVDRLVHNASILPLERARTAEGLEATYATNIVGPLRFQFRLDETAERLHRVVWVSSGGMYLVPLDLRALRGDVKRFDGVKAYAHTKRAQVIVAERMAERFGPRLRSFSMHPGWADTPSVESSLPRFHALTKSFLRTPDQGADTVVWLTATARELAPGGFFFDREAKDSEVAPGTRTSTEVRAQLFEMLERDAGIPSTFISTSG
jgi:NAD(P)-dependent dehydrogenase (short-subunit alcohol dehydrogenase family)